MSEALRTLAPVYHLYFYLPPEGEFLTERTSARLSLHLWSAEQESQKTILTSSYNQRRSELILQLASRDSTQQEFFFSNNKMVLSLIVPFVKWASYFYFAKHNISRVGFLLLHFVERLLWEAEKVLFLCLSLSSWPEARTVGAARRGGGAPWAYLATRSTTQTEKGKDASKMSGKRYYEI